MGTTTSNLNIDELKSEIANLSPEEVAQQLLDVRVKQRVQQKKYHSTEASKSYQKKRAAKIKAMTELAKTQPSTKPGFANLYEQIKHEANELADQKLAESDAENETELVNEE